MLTVGTHRGTGKSRLEIYAHDILDEEADWNSPTWRFKAGEIHRLVTTVRHLYEFIPEEFTLLASWAFDPAKREAAISRPDLLTLIEGNRLGNRVLYRVLPAET